MKVKFSGISVVATIHTATGLRRLPGIDPAKVDLIELRLDALANQRTALDDAVRYSKRIPFLITARDPNEGGAKLLSERDRLDLIMTYRRAASAIDVELANARRILPMLPRNLPRILSVHDFDDTPTVARMRAAWKRASALGCACFKVAATTNTPAQLARLVQLLASPDRPSPIAAMGMGRLGRLSRLVLPMCGSSLTYGFIDKPQVPGQWPAEVLKQRLDEIRSEFTG
jgi:3-dehydroquinate dehydratase-1